MNNDHYLDSQFKGHNPYEAPDVEPEEVQAEECEECVGDPGDKCLICGEVIPEPPGDEDPDAWSGGFARNH